MQRDQQMEYRPTTSSQIANPFSQSEYRPSNTQPFSQTTSSYRPPRDNYQRYNRDYATQVETPILDQPRQRQEFKSIYSVLANTKGVRYINSLKKDDAKRLSIPRPFYQQLEDLFEEKVKELDMEENQNQENILEEFAQLTNYTTIKKKNILESRTVFKSLDDGYFRCENLRLLNINQALNCLPIYAKKAEIIRKYPVSDVLIIKSSAGSGKSTQLPQYLLDCCKGRILVTQPRVIAAESVALRVRDELSYGKIDGKIIGYIAGPKCMIDANMSEVVYITEHEFIVQVMNDRYNFLSTFEAFIIDEAHELRKTTLEVLAILKNYLIRNRGTIKIIVTSATLDTDIYKSYFSSSGPESESFRLQIIEAITPTYEVQQFYTFFPDLATSVVENTCSHLLIVFEHIKRTFSSQGVMPNILVFLPSIAEIKLVKKFILYEDHEKKFAFAKEEIDFIVEEMHGGLKPAEKNRVLRPPPETKSKVRIILATKIAETALTLEDVFYVIDSGLETEYYFDEISKKDFHKEVFISKSSAIQRKGRAGRIGNGFCFKMYKEEDEQAFELTSKPEILRMDIGDVILTQIELEGMFKLPDLLFFDKIDREATLKVTEELKRIEALSKENDTNVMSKKGKFMIQAGLKGLVAAFLYECIRLGARELGIIATTALHVKGIFWNNDTLKKFCKLELNCYGGNGEEVTNSDLTQLGDLAPLIWIFKRYEHFDNVKRKEFYQNYGVSEAEMARLIHSRNNIEFIINSNEQLLPEVDPIARSLDKVSALQLAFLKTFPGNVCMRATKEANFPYFMMIDSSQLIKIHGSSVIGEFRTRPKWVCCQNLVISGVTERPMAKFIVPISEDLIKNLPSILLKKAKRIDEQDLPQVITNHRQATAILRFLRAKNHNEHIQKKLKETGAYLETDEDKECTYYFYISNHNKDKKREIEKGIQKMIESIDKEVLRTIFRRNFISPISDKAKLLINEHGKAKDVLDSFEFISMMIKSTNKEIYDHLVEQSRRLHLTSNDINISLMKTKNIMLIHLKDKHIAKVLFERCKPYVSLTKKAAMFPICGLNKSDFGGKFQKWKVELMWYEGPKDSTARINFDDVGYLKFVLEKLQRSDGFEQGTKVLLGRVNPEFEAGKKPNIEILNALGNEGLFEDEVDIENYIKSFARQCPANMNTSVFIQCYRKSMMAQDQEERNLLYDYNVDVDDAFHGSNYDNLRMAIQNFTNGNLAEASDVKELKFIQTTGLNREIAKDLDIEMRVKLEEMFPIIKKYQGFCFKPRGMTNRRMLIFPSNCNYQTYMSDMQKLKSEFDGKFMEKLNSKVRVLFKGKYILRIDDEMYDKFSTKIKQMIHESSLGFSERKMIRRTDVTLYSSFDAAESMRSCSTNIMKLLAPTYLDIDDQQKVNISYIVNTKPGKEFLVFINNYFKGRVVVRFEPLTSRFIFNGVHSDKHLAQTQVQRFIASFATKIKEDLIHLKNPRAFLNTKRKIMTFAEELDCKVVTTKSAGSQDEPSLVILSHAFQKEGDPRRPQDVETARKDRVWRLEKYIKDALTAADDSRDILLSKLDEETKIDIVCSLCKNLAEDKYRLFCSHLFCKGCLREYILQERISEGLKCPISNCTKLVYLIDMINLLKQEELKVVFRGQKRPFLEKNSHYIKPCPSEGCDNILFKHKTVVHILEHIFNVKRLESEERKENTNGLHINLDDSVMEASSNSSRQSPVEHLSQYEKDLIEEHQQSQLSPVSTMFYSAPIAASTAHLVFCQCCGHDYCFNCLQTHYGESCNSPLEEESFAPSRNADRGQPRVTHRTYNCPGCPNRSVPESPTPHCPNCQRYFCPHCTRRIFSTSAELSAHLSSTHGQAESRGNNNGRVELEYNPFDDTD